MKDINNKDALRLASKYSIISVMMYTIIRVLTLMIPIIMKSLIDMVYKGGDYQCINWLKKIKLFHHQKLLN